VLGMELVLGSAQCWPVWYKEFKAVLNFIPICIFV
jgi:hypothetical protein